jgi:hypothetical protein
MEVNQNASPAVVSLELRAAEREIDGYYLRNRLARQPFAKAGWRFLAACEEQVIREIVRADRGVPRDDQDHAALSDSVVVNTKWPMRWLLTTCRPGGEIPRAYSEDGYQAATDLYDLGLQYSSFESAFTFASLGVLTLTVEGHCIQASDALRRDTRYDAYDRLRQPRSRDARIEGVDVLIEALTRSVRFDREWFYYDTSPQLIEKAKEILSPLLEPRFELPDDWTFSQFSLQEFRAAARVIFVLAYLHFHARMIAAARGCVGLGYARALYVVTHTELLTVLKAHAGLSRETAAAIVETLTFGRRGQRAPDPALQPLILLTPGHRAIAPSLVLNSSLERNFAVLLNRLPEERSAYARRSHDRETISRDRAIRAIEGLGFRCWHGDLPQWGTSSEIDLVIISDAERRCLALEMKAFIGPADPREVHERSLEIQRGIEQIRERRAKANDLPAPFRAALRIDGTYRVTWAVASETSVGTAYTQDPHVPVVQTRHIVDKLRKDSQLGVVCDWLGASGHLPVEGVHYETVDLTVSIDKWSLAWYGIKALVDEYI